jgi:lipoteichoic acid synthase
MKRVLFIVLAPLLFVLNTTAQKNTGLLFNQEIRYRCKDAREVFLVWGLNNWKLDSALRNEGTFVKNNLYYTPMDREDGVFKARFKVRSNTMIDYVFWITKGPASYTTDIWDTNLPSKDYHTYVSQETTTTIESKLKVRPKEYLSLLDFAKPLSINLLILMIFLFVLKRSVLHNRKKAGPYLIIIASGLVLLFMLFGLRQSITGVSWELYLHPFKNIGEFFVSGFHDSIFVLVITLTYLLLVFLFKRSSKVQLMMSFSFAVLCVISLIVGILNIRIVSALGKPFNLQWLYYSDFLKSTDAKSTISTNLSPSYLSNVFLLTLAGICSVIIIILVAEITVRSERSKKAAFVSLGSLFVGYLVFAGINIAGSKRNYDKLSNPFIAFAESLDFFSERPELFTMSIPDSLQFSIKKNKLKAELSSGHNIKNVLLFVMESTPAEYIDSYNSKFKATPELARLSVNAIQFENIYAHAPATNLSMVSLLGSVYPWLSCFTLTNEHPELRFPTLSSELKQRGYRTSFFNSADNRFQNADKFLACRNFDQITDCQGDACRDQHFHPEENWHFPDGKDDECTADQLAEWILSEKEKPFFAAMWTYQTHYPYFLRGEKKQFETTDTMFNRYLNALHHSDQVFGKLMRRLNKEGLLNSTLVIVVGDHGEAFGRHDQITHAQKVYEENLHIPCLFINPVFTQTKNNAVGGLVDIAPTVMDFLGYTSPDNWQGENLLAVDKTNRVYFFAPWSDYLFGYREGDHKFIFNVTKGTTEVYDVVNDPEEKINLISKFRDKLPLHTQRMAAWVQYHNKFMDDLLKK